MNKPSFWGFIEARKGELQAPVRRLFIRRLVRVYLRRAYPRVNFRVRESLAEDIEYCEDPRDLLKTFEEPSVKAKMLQSFINKFASN